MTKKRNAKATQPIEGEVISANPTPRNQIRLASIKDCRRELAKVYADAKYGNVDPQNATRLTYILVAITNMIKDHELEERVKKLEEQSDEIRTSRRRG